MTLVVRISLIFDHARSTRLILAKLRNLKSMTKERVADTTIPQMKWLLDTQGPYYN